MASPSTIAEMAAGPLEGLVYYPLIIAFGIGA